MENNNKILERAELFEDNDWSFSSLYLWKELSKKAPSSFVLFRFADQNRLCGFYKKAEELFNKIDMDSVPESKKYLYYLFLGQLYKDMGKMDKAEEFSYKSIQCNPKSTEAYIFFAEILSIKESFSEAISILKSALNKEGDIDEIHYNLSTCYARLGLFERAVESINNCLRLDSNFPNAQTLLNDYENLYTIAPDILSLQTEKGYKAASPDTIIPQQRQ